MFLNDMLKEISKYYPNIWQQVKNFRKEKGKSLPDWADYCYLPIAACIAITTQGDSSKLIECMSCKYNPPLLASLISWRVTQGIYRFEPELYSVLINQSFEGNLPCDLLKRLPEWCVYIECYKGTTFAGIEIKGFLAHLEYDVKDKRDELRFVLFPIDEKDILYTVLHLGDWTINESIERVKLEAEKNYKLLLNTPEYSKDIKEEYKHFLKLEKEINYFDFAKDYAKLINLLLYLCADNIDMPKIPQHPKERVRLSGNVDIVKEPKVWTVGERISLFLRKYNNKTYSEQKGFSHSSPRPHIRKAHWHSFWTGKRNSNERKLILKWLPPIPVGVSEEEIDKLPPVIRLVKYYTK